jgi:thioredoxin 1
VACHTEIKSRCPRDTGRIAALRMLAMPPGIAALRALRCTPSRTSLGSHFSVTGHQHGARGVVSESLCLRDLRAPPGAFTMSSELIKHISDASFESDVLKSDKPVLVDYWAEWCGPCKMIAPILDDVAKEYGDKLQIAKLNVDENRDVPAKFGIRGIPTLMLFKNGQAAATKVGALSKAQLTAFLDGHL